ncbi:hypothetical protein BAUCODRAFT_54384, partial [Baudoinia panamericana UAMH 10762]
MDPFATDSELLNIHTAFTQSQYSTVLSDFSPADFSPSNRLPAQILQYRAQCALGQSSEVLSSISESDARATPDLAAMRAFARFCQNPERSEDAVTEAERLAERYGGENLHVQLLCGIILARTPGKSDAALQLLSKHQGSLDAVALMVQIHLTQNRTDLAVKEAQSARSFAQDALLVNLAESWIGMRKGGQDEYQKAFYVFEELAQAPGSRSVGSLVAQAVSEIHLGRLEEAEVGLEAAVGMEGQGEEVLAEAWANKAVLDAALGRTTGESVAKLKSLKAGHELLADMDAKREAFRAAAAKYS